MRSIFWLILCGVVLATIALVVRSGMLARKNPGQPINAAMRAAMEGTVYQWTDHETGLIAQNYNGAADTKSGLRYLVRQPGIGTASPRHGQVVVINFESRILDGETKLDASANHGGSYHFRLGEEAIAAGWAEAIMTMKKGEKRTLLIPYWLAYGEKGVKGKIPSKAALVTDLELVDFQ